MADSFYAEVFTDDGTVIERLGPLPERLAWRAGRKKAFGYKDAGHEHERVRQAASAAPQVWTQINIH